MAIAFDANTERREDVCPIFAGGLAGCPEEMYTSRNGEYNSLYAVASPSLGKYVVATLLTAQLRPRSVQLSRAAQMHLNTECVEHRRLHRQCVGGLLRIIHIGDVHMIGPVPCHE